MVARRVTHSQKFRVNTTASSGTICCLYVRLGIQSVSKPLELAHMLEPKTFDNILATDNN